MPEQCLVQAKVMQKAEEITANWEIRRLRGKIVDLIVEQNSVCAYVYMC